jgi:hypothetical protein
MLFILNKYIFIFYDNKLTWQGGLWYWAFPFSKSSLPHLTRVWSKVQTFDSRGLSNFFNNFEQIFNLIFFFVLSFSVPGKGQQIFSQNVTFRQLVLFEFAALKMSIGKVSSGKSHSTRRRECQKVYFGGENQSGIWLKRYNLLIHFLKKWEK